MTETVAFRCGAPPSGRISENRTIAARLAEVADLLEQGRADRFRVAAWRRAVQTIGGLHRPVRDILREDGWSGLDRLPGIGPVLGRAIFSLLTTGRLPMLDRLRAEADPIRALMSVPGVGPLLARRLHAELGIDDLYELESAALDGRLARVSGIGEKRLAGIRDSLAARLARLPLARSADPAPPLAELLAVDREYREAAGRETLPRITPRRFNPRKKPWLPILHTARGGRRYSALFSNTARAHELGRTRDWVVVYLDGESRQAWTVVTETSGPLTGMRVVRGREAECLEHYSESPSPSLPVRRAS